MTVKKITENMNVFQVKMTKVKLNYWRIIFQNPFSHRKTIFPSSESNSTFPGILNHVPKFETSLETSSTGNWIINPIPFQPVQYCFTRSLPTYTTDASCEASRLRKPFFAWTLGWNNMRVQTRPKRIYHKFFKSSRQFATHSAKMFRKDGDGHRRKWRKVYLRGS